MAKILLVEDDNNLREIYGARLSAEGYDIVSAPDGEEALAIAVKERPDLIISDIMMPKISGFDMLDILRNAPETKDTKIIMMTALSQAEDKERADKLGADLYLVKSQVTLEDVAESVHKILGNDKSQQPATQPETEQPTDNTPSVPEPTAQKEDAPALVPAPSQTEAVSAPTAVEPAQEPPQPAEPTLAPAPTPSPTPTAPPPTTPDPAPVASATPQVPSSAPVQPADPTAAVLPQNDTPAVTAVPITNPAPAAAPVVQPPPSEPPANLPSSPATDSQPPKPEPKKIEVVLPDDDADKPAEPGADKNALQAEPPAPHASDETLTIGPNVTEALAQEESITEGSKEKVTKTEEPTSVAVSQPSTVIKPTEGEATTADTPPEEPSVKQGSPHEENNPNKKIIQPLNDPTKGPDLNALLAQEEQKEQAPSYLNTEADSTPATQQPQQDTSQDEQSDDFSKISL
jgi:CheY-like chemotaxis protein